MLIDYVSDLRAPTPTGAAEFAVPVKAEISATLSTAQSRLSNAVNRYFEERRSRLDGLSRGIPNLEQILAERRQKLDDRVERLQLAFGNMLKNKQNQIAQTSLRPYYILNIFEKKQENLKNLSLRLDSVSIDSPGSGTNAAKRSTPLRRRRKVRRWKSVLLTAVSKPKRNERKMTLYKAIC